MTAVDEPVTARKTDAQELHEYIGWRIRKYRLACNWSLTDLAVQVNKHVATVSGWEAGSRAISVADLVAVARALGIPVGALVSVSGFSPEEVLPS